MMSNWKDNGGNFANGFCGGRGGNGAGHLIGGGLMMLVFVVVVALIIWLIWRGKRRHLQNFKNFHGMQNLSNMTTDELESELAKRKQIPTLESEVADLKKQLEELKKDKTE